MIDSFGGVRPRAIDDALLDGFVLALLLRSKVAIGLTFLNQLAGGRAMLVGIVGLKNDLFIVIKPQPFQSFDDRVSRFVGGTLQIGVFYSEQELAAGFTREQPIE